MNGKNNRRHGHDVRILTLSENGFEYTCKADFTVAITAVFASSEWRLRAGKKSEEIADKFGKGVFGKMVEEVYQSVLQECGREMI